MPEHRLAFERLQHGAPDELADPHRLGEARGGEGRLLIVIVVVLGGGRARRRGEREAEQAQRGQEGAAIHPQIPANQLKPWLSQYPPG